LYPVIVVCISTGEGTSPMKTVLIANKDVLESKTIADVISQEFNISVINTVDEFDGDLNKFNVVLVDCNFTPDRGMDFVSRILDMAYLPILVVTPPDDSQCAAEALKMGAFNYIVKTPRHNEILNVVINEAIQRFDQYEQMKQVIMDLKKRVAELEEQLARLGKNDEKVPQVNGAERANEKQSAFNDVLSRLKKGEINLPAPPQIQMEFEKMMKDGSSILEIAKLLRQDISISSKLISISNSALYQGLKENKTLEQAIGRLGLNTARKYVEVICNRSLYTTQKKKHLALMEKLWKHSISCGFASQFICESLHMKQADEVFTMGLVHDIGKLILLQIYSELDIDISLEANDVNYRADLVQSLAQNHGAFGATLLKRWGFSEIFQQVALFHHKLESADPIAKELVVVSFANSLVKSLGYHFGDQNGIKIEDCLAARLLKITPEVISKIKDQVQSHMGELKTIF
jgi:HD-like signal output (HDOD) protein/FixJ family two-component response regulator